MAWRLPAIVAAVAAVLLYFVPLVRVVPLEAARAEAAEGRFDPTAFAADFWESRLTPALGNADDASKVLAALADDAATAGDTYGVRVGVSRSFFLFLQGEGEIVEVGPKGVLVRVGDHELLLKTGPLFGSAIRDATGLLQASDAPGSREYNALAAELNKIAEERVVPSLEAASVGERLRFVGCGKVASADRYAPPLEVHPVLVEAL